MKLGEPEKKIKMRKPVWIACLLFFTVPAYSQSIGLDQNSLEAVHVSMSTYRMDGKDGVIVIKDPSLKKVDEPTFAKLKQIEFKNGTIEVSILCKLLPNAADSARGFIGVAFRINDGNTKFECIYVRPLNGRDSIQIRRNHTIQYFSFPNYKFNRLRKDTPGEYESYADIGMNEWIRLKIEVKETFAKLYINDGNDIRVGTSGEML